MSLGMFNTEIVHPWEEALLYVNGKYARRLETGRHYLANLGRTIEVHRVALTPQMTSIPLTEVMTSDHFALRMNLFLTFQIADARKVIETQYHYRAQINVFAAESLRHQASAVTLDELLANSSRFSEVLLNEIKDKIGELRFTQAAIGGLILPPETRRMLTEVERAKREGEATLERARSEHAALRTLANAARLLKDNPDLMKLRTLQAVSPTGKGATLVLGQEGFGIRAG